MSDTAKQLYKEAYEAYAREAWSECRAKAFAAWGLAKHASIAAQLGECELKLGMHREAAEHLNFFLQHSDGVEPTRIDEARALLTEAKRNIATLNVTSNIDGAKLRIGDDSAGSIPITVFLPPGGHELVAERTGYRPAIRTLEARPGAEETWAVQLLPAATNGDEDSTQHPILPLVIVGGILGAAGIVAGSVLIVLSGNAADDADSLTQSIVTSGGTCRSSSPDPRCADVESKLATERDARNGAIAGFVAGGAIGVATIIYAVVSVATSDDATNETVSVEPLISPAYGGANISVRF